jgi:hypothetical protein
MKGLIKVLILTLAFSNTPILQHSKIAYSILCVLCDLCVLNSKILLTNKGWNGAS